MSVVLSPRDFIVYAIRDSRRQCEGKRSIGSMTEIAGEARWLFKSNGMPHSMTVMMMMVTRSNG